MHPYNASLNNVVSIKVIEMLIYDAPAYHDQVVRPYAMFLQQNDLDILRNRLGDYSPRHAGKIPVAQFAEASASALLPQQAPERQAGIVNGWQSARQRFRLTIRASDTMGIPATYQVMGYTEHPVTSDITGLRGTSAPADDKALFIINSVTQLNERHGFNNVMGSQSSIVGARSSHVLANNQPLSFTTTAATKIRPEDVCTNLMVKAEYGPDSNLTILNPSSTIASTPSFSDRANSVNSFYMSKMVNGWSEAMRSASMGEEPSETASKAKTFTQEAATMRDPFMTFLGKLHQTAVESTFTLNELGSLDPEFGKTIRPRYMRIDPVQQVMAMSNSTELMNVNPMDTLSMGAATRHAQLATMLTLSVPALCVETLLGGISFNCHNFTPDRRPAFVEGGVWGITSGESIVGTNLQANLERFRYRFETEVWPAISMNGQHAIAIQVWSNTVSETRVSIAIDGVENARAFTFVAPTFADALMAPVSTIDGQRVSSLASNFNTLLDDVLQGSVINPITVAHNTPFGNI